MRTSFCWAALTGAVLLQGNVHAAEPVVELNEGSGRELVQGMCNTCHSTDYIVINSRFMDEQKWVAVMDKMVKTFGAPIDADSQRIIVRYLTEQYGVAASGWEPRI